MVATTYVVATATAVATDRIARRIPAMTRDPRKDAAIKGIAGLGCMLVSVKVENAYGKGALIGVGVGLTANAAGTYVPFLG